MKKVTSTEMNSIDAFSIKAIGIPGIVLMENAALKVVKNIDLEKYNKFTIVCGVGNNGGDGLAVARHLIVEGKDVDVFIVGNIDKGSKDFYLNYNILDNMVVDIHHISSEENLKKLSKSLESSDMTIDSIFGTGLKRNVEGIFEKTISLINEKSNYILAIDIPSGLNADNGEVLNICINASKTVTFQLPKVGLYEFNGKKYAGEVIVEPIGIPNMAINKVLGKI